jgi:hypothetical protein
VLTPSSIGEMEGPLPAKMDEAQGSGSCERTELWPVITNTKLMLTITSGNCYITACVSVR